MKTCCGKLPIATAAAQRYSTLAWQTRLFEYIPGKVTHLPGESAAFSFMTPLCAGMPGLLTCYAIFLPFAIVALETFWTCAVVYTSPMPLCWHTI